MNSPGNMFYFTRSCYSCFSKIGFKGKWYNLGNHHVNFMVIKAKLSNELRFPLQKTGNNTELSSTLKLRDKKLKSPALLPSEVQKENSLLISKSILSSSDVSNVYNIYLKNKSIFELEQFYYTMKRISELFLTSDMALSDIHGNAIFQSLCYDIWKLTPQLEANTVLNIYKTLVDLKVPTKALIMQSLLQMMRHQINLLEIKDIIFLHRLLIETDTCKIKDALQLAIPRVLENCMQMYKFKYLNFSEISQLLQMCIIGEVKGFENLLKFLHEYTLPELLRSEKEDVNKNVMSLLSNILDIFIKIEYDIGEEYQDICDEVVSDCLNYLNGSEVMDNKDETAVLAILNKLGKCSSLEVPLPSSSKEQFLNLTSQTAIKFQWKVNSLCRVIISHFKMSYVNEELVSLALSMILEDLKAGLSLDNAVLAIIPAIAVIDMPEEECKQALDNIFSNLELPLDNLKIPWIRLALELLSMNYVNENLLDNILEGTFLKRYINLQPNSYRTFTDLLRLDRALNLLAKSSNFRVSEELKNRGKEEVGSLPELSLRNILEKILGNGNKLVSNFVTSNGSVIDHLIILDEEGRPIEITSETDADTIIPSRKFALIEIPETWTVEPGMKLKGSFKLELRLLQMEGFTTVPLFENEIDIWEEASPFHIANKLQNFGIKI